MAPLTRHRVRRACATARRYLHARRARIYAAAAAVTRGAALELAERDHALEVAFIYDPVGDHFAETDGTTIWLNVHKDFGDDDLYLTFVHEELHGYVRRAAGGHYLSEETEHRMMQLVDSRLV